MSGQRFKNAYRRNAAAAAAAAFAVQTIRATGLAKTKERQMPAAYSHLVLHARLFVGVLPIYLDVQVPIVLLVRLASKASLDLVSGADEQHAWDVEYGLFPVGVAAVGTRAEAHRFVTRVEGDVEPGQKCVYVYQAREKKRRVSSVFARVGTRVWARSRSSHSLLLAAQCAIPLSPLP